MNTILHLLVGLTVISVIMVRTLLNVNTDNQKNSELKKRSISIIDHMMLVAALGFFDYIGLINSKMRSYVWLSMECMSREVPSEHAKVIYFGIGLSLAFCFINYLRIKLRVKSIVPVDGNIDEHQ